MISRTVVVASCGARRVLLGRPRGLDFSDVMFPSSTMCSQRSIDVRETPNVRAAVLLGIPPLYLIIIALIPLALRGVRFRPLGAAVLLRRNLLIYGLGGLVAPFIGIKIIDVLITALHLV